MTEPLSEFEIIARYFNRPAQQESVAQSIGDDCALLTVPDGFQLATSMDTLVAGRHFPESASADQIAQRCFCTCLSDLAAMGAKPAWFTLSLSLPQADPVWLTSFSAALFDLASKYDCDLVGGDTTRGPLVITLQVHGFVQKPLMRRGAMVGDSVFVTGTLGDGAAALSLLKNEITVKPETKQYLLKRFYCPEPQIETGLLLIDIASAAIDISDGLLADLHHIAKASEVDIQITADNIPLSTACVDTLNEQALSAALSGGDDYQLAFTVPETKRQTISAMIKQGQLSASEIGKVLACKEDPHVDCYENGQVIEITTPFGYQHF